MFAWGNYETGDVTELNKYRVFQNPLLPLAYYYSMSLSWEHLNSQVPGPLEVAGRGDSSKNQSPGQTLMSVLGSRRQISQGGSTAQNLGRMSHCFLPVWQQVHRVKFTSLSRWPFRDMEQGLKHCS